MIGAARRYRELLLELALQRMLAGGALAPDVESPLVGALDRCWRDMSALEQDEAEERHAQGRRVAAPDVLAIEDQAIVVGGHVSPRRTAA